MDIEEIKTNLLFARSCATASRYQQMGEPCNDALEIINRRWADPQFRSKELYTIAEQTGCMTYLRENLKTPISVSSFNKLAVKAAKHVRKQQEEAAAYAPDTPPEIAQSRAQPQRGLHQPAGLRSTATGRRARPDFKRLIYY